MDYKSDYITKKAVRDNCAYYSTYWSPLYPTNRYLITRTVPARPGLFRLFYRDGKGKVSLFYMERVWYGGLRSEIRRASDPMEVSDPARREVLLRRKCFFSYTIVESKRDMFDLISAYSGKLLPEREAPADSGRYEKVFLR